MQWLTRNDSQRRLLPLSAFLLIASGALGLPVYAQDAPPVPPAPPTPAPPTYPTPEPAPPVPPAPARRHVPIFGPEVGFYVPTSDKTADAFGNTFTNVGVGFGPVRKARMKGEYYFDLNVISNRRRGSDFVMIPAGFAWRKSFSRQGSTAINPYFGYGLNVIGAQLQSERFGLLSRFRFGAGANIFTGITFGESAYLQARYYQTTRIRSFDLSGAGLSLGIRF